MIDEIDINSAESFLYSFLKRTLFISLQNNYKAWQKDNRLAKCRLLRLLVPGQMNLMIDSIQKFGLIEYHGTMTGQLSSIDLEKWQPQYDKQYKLSRR